MLLLVLPLCVTCAALAAANSAKENGAKKVLVLEKANRKERGGNTFFSGGLFRIAFDDPHQLKAMVPDAEDIIPGFYEDVLPYTKEDMWSDLLRVTHNKTDRELSTILIDKMASRYSVLQSVSEANSTIFSMFTVS